VKFIEVFMKFYGFPVSGFYKEAGNFCYVGWLVPEDGSDCIAILANDIESLKINLFNFCNEFYEDAHNYEFVSMAPQWLIEKIKQNNIIISNKNGDLECLVQEYK